MTGELRYPINALVSFHYFPDPALVESLARGGLRLIGDSGAFSALTSGNPISLETFAEWAITVRPFTCWTACLDVIGDADATWRHWRRLRSLGIDTIPTLHYGHTPDLLDRYVAEGVDFFGLGGMVGRKSEPMRLLRWAAGVMRYCRDKHPHVRFHGWGISHPILTDSLPWWSVDSSGFAKAYRWGEMSVWNPDRRKLERVELDGRGAYRVGPLLRKHYGVEPAAVARSVPANRDLLIRVAACSYQLREDYLRARHGVTPPTYGVRAPNLVGTAMHAVDGSPDNLAALTRVRQPQVGTHLHAVSTATKDYLPMSLTPATTPSED